MLNKQPLNKIKYNYIGSHGGIVPLTGVSSMQAPPLQQKPGGQLPSGAHLSSTGCPALMFFCAVLFKTFAPSMLNKFFIIII